ncbi:MAG: L-lactate permease, partial [Planctomycetes bacterium]|nr:L-lactate permease [Planctomycetota bacterium]
MQEDPHPGPLPEYREREADSRGAGPLARTHEITDSMTWTQIYDPLGAPFLSTLLAGSPIVLLLGLLVAGVSAQRAAFAGLAAALIAAMFGFGMPARLAAASAAYGACFGLLPIGWIV